MASHRYFGLHFAQRMTMIIITVKVAAITSHTLAGGKWVDRLSFHPQLVHFHATQRSNQIKSEHPMKIIYNIYRFYVAKIWTSFTRRSLCFVLVCNVTDERCDFHSLITQFLFGLLVDISVCVFFSRFFCSSSFRRMRFTWNYSHLARVSTRFDAVARSLVFARRCHCYFDFPL